MHETTAEGAPEVQRHRAESPLSEWRAPWALEDGQPAWLRDSVAVMDAYAQGLMGHS
jgi:hypothetical protein